MHSLCVPLPKKAIIPNAYIRIPSILCFIHVPAKYVFSSVLRIELLATIDGKLCCTND